MMLNALWVRRGDLLGSHVCKMHRVMHSISNSSCIHRISSMIGCRSIDQTKLFILAKNMGSNQAPLSKKKFYQVKIKSPEVASLQELGQLMGQLQRQAFRKAYGKHLGPS